MHNVHASTGIVPTPTTRVPQSTVIQRPQPKNLVVNESLLAQYYVYILTNRSGALYVGVTNDLTRRIYEHKNKFAGGFTKRYNIDRLVHYEMTEDVNAAITREKQIKGWSRKKKFNLIRSSNSRWLDLSEGWVG